MKILSAFDALAIASGRTSSRLYSDELVNSLAKILVAAESGRKEVNIYNPSLDTRNILQSLGYIIDLAYDNVNGATIWARW